MTEVSSLTGRLLVATPVLADPNFDRAVVLLLDHDEEGSLGVVLNRPTPVDVGDILEPWAALAGEPGVVFQGGPVSLDAALGVAVVPTGGPHRARTDLRAGPESDLPAGSEGQQGPGSTAAPPESDRLGATPRDPASSGAASEGETSGPAARGTAGPDTPPGPASGSFLDSGTDTAGDAPADLPGDPYAELSAELSAEAGADGADAGADAALAADLGLDADGPLGWRRVHGAIGLVDLEAPPELLAAELGSLRIFAGYAGWGPGQLEDELSEGAWYVVDSEPGDVSSPAPEGLWRSVLRRQRSELALVATYPDDPSLN